jgi:hypothetical protein
VNVSDGGESCNGEAVRQLVRESAERKREQEKAALRRQNWGGRRIRTEIKDFREVWDSIALGKMNRWACSPRQQEIAFQNYIHNVQLPKCVAYSNMVHRSRAERQASIAA